MPRGDAAWEAVLADPNKLKTRLTEAEQEAFFVAHPGCHIPFGVVDKSVFRTRHDQLVAYNDQPGGYALTIERDTFFDDAVAVASDRAPTADGRYMPGTTVTLTATERAILQKLLDNRGHIVTYDALCEAVWGSDYYGCENSLNVHIRHLREKVEEQPSQPAWILTARGLGYKLAKEGTK